MTECLAQSDVKALGESALSEIDRQISSLPPALCLPFYEAASKMETELLALYRMVAMLARKEENLEKVALWWGSMVAQCDRYAARLLSLSQAHPNCGAEIFYDRVLDLRNKCQRLQQMHS